MADNSIGSNNSTLHEARTGYAPVNGLQMYYEIHGEPRDDAPPVVLIHGAFSGIGTSFGAFLPGLSRTRQLIGVELQGHARTADIDRPLRGEYLADDIAALLDYLNVERVDLFAYSMGTEVALHFVLKYPERVRKMVLASGSYTLAGMHPGLMDGLDEMQPEMLHGSPFHDEYMALAPDPDAFPAFFRKKQEHDRALKDFPADAIRGIQAPTMIVIGDSDIVQPEHAVEMFRLLGGGVVGDLVGLPNARLAILPGTTHITVAYRADWLVPMIDEFLDAPVTAS
jgi:pimeloyl-ACP methyl ester carboxylesterase